MNINKDLPEDNLTLEAELRTLLIDLVMKGHITTDTIIDGSSLDNIFTKIASDIGIDFSYIPVGIFTLKQTIDHESDRGCALMMASFLEDQLFHLLSESFVDDPKTIKGLLTGTGGLSSFSARIDMAYLLGIITPMIRHDLHLIRKIRNEFAHNPGRLSFSDHDIIQRCKELSFNILPNLSPREKFIQVALGTFGFITGARKNARRPESIEEINMNDFDLKDLSHSFIKPFSSRFIELTRGNDKKLIDSEEE